MIMILLIGVDGFGSGKWLSDNESVLSVNKITGEGFARGEGTTQGSQTPFLTIGYNNYYRHFAITKT